MVIEKSRCVTFGHKEHVYYSREGMERDSRCRSRVLVCSCGEQRIMLTDTLLHELVEFAAPQSTDVLPMDVAVTITMHPRFTVEWLDGHEELYEDIMVDHDHSFVRLTSYNEDKTTDRYEIIPAVVIRRTWYG